MTANPIPAAMMEKMQGVLEALEIKVNETLSQEEEYSYTMKLEVVGYDWTVCGHGRSEEACRADAHLRLITAMQHLQLPKHFYDALRGRIDCEDILYVYPDAEVRNIKRSIFSPLLRDMEYAFEHSEGYSPDRETLLNRWIEWNGSPMFAFVPFHSLTHTKQIMLPYRIVNKLCYPHNVASGRTYEEALAHALVKVIKKTVGEILGYNYTHPEDDAWDVWKERCPQLYMLINDLRPEPTGNVSKETLDKLIATCLTFTREIYVRDCSFLGIPSVSVYIPGASLVQRELFFQEERRLPSHADEVLHTLQQHYDEFCNIYSDALAESYPDDCSIEYTFFCSASPNELTAAYHLYLGDEASALSTLYQDSRPYKRVQAIICELEMKKEGVDISHRDSILKKLFGKAFCPIIQKYWRDGDTFARFFKQIIDEPIEERLKELSFPYHVLSLLNRIRRMINS